MSGERILPGKIHFRNEYLLYLKQIYTYNWVKNIIPVSSICLDLGCGEGYGTKLLSLWVKKIIGVDVEAKVINEACRKYSSETCAFRKYDGKTLPFADNTFDAAVSFQVIEHVKDEFSFIAEAYRVLKKAGYLSWLRRIKISGCRRIKNPGMYIMCGNILLVKPKKFLKADLVKLIFWVLMLLMR